MCENSGKCSQSPSCYGTSRPCFSLAPGWRFFIGEGRKASPPNKIPKSYHPGRLPRLTFGRNEMKKKATKKKANAGLKVIQPNVAGIDLGSIEHWVCGPDRKDGLPDVQTFGTTTPQLNKLADWLESRGVKSVAMESTGVYWLPIGIGVAAKVSSRLQNT
jgi:hypothetical protein